MNYEEIKERVDWGEEFQTTEELFENGRVEGKILLQIWGDKKQYL